MGVMVDTISLFGVDLPSAINRVSGATAPNVANAGSAGSASASIPSRSSDMVEVLEHRRIAESPFARSSPDVNSPGGMLSDMHLNNRGQETPSAAMSLGMSSLSLRQPFASPAVMMLSSMSVPASLHRFDLQCAPGSNLVDPSADNSQQPRVLFDMSPGLTPIGVGVSAVESGTDQDAGPHRDFLDESLNVRNTLFNSGSSYPPTHTVAGNDNTYLPSGSIYQQSPNNDMYFRGGGRLAFGSEPANEVTAAAGRRRVSFGPTARLSFSSSLGDNNNNLFGNSTGSSGSLLHAPDSAGVAYDTRGDDSMFSRPPEEDMDDTYPSKVLRMHNQSGPAGYHTESASLVYSPSVDATVDRADVVPYSASKENVSHNTIGDSRLNSDVPETGVSESTKVPVRKGNPVNNVNGGQNNKENELMQVSGIQRAAALLSIFACAYQSLCFYRCVDCINILHNLPAAHFGSGWVQQLVGRAYYELCEYKPALLSLKEMVRMEPFRVKGTEILSTVLWHLKREKELSALAQQVPCIIIVVTCILRFVNRLLRWINKHLRLGAW
jgi:hypothetical protein